MRALKILGVAFGGGLALYAILYIIRFQTTLPIDGVVVDASTGKPVGKVLVHAYWHFSQSNPVDTTSAEEGVGTVTDEQGRFRIPRKNVTTVLGSFDDQYLQLRHPLYDSRDVQVYSQMKKGYQLGTVAHSQLEITLPFTTLRDRYRRFEDRLALAAAIDNLQPDFFIAMRDDYDTTYDLQLIMRTLETLSKRFPEPRRPTSNTELAFKSLQFRMRNLIQGY